MTRRRRISRSGGRPGLATWFRRSEGCRSPSTLRLAKTSNNTHRAIQAPDAPSLIVLEKKTGRYVARDDEHIGPNNFHATWSLVPKLHLGTQ